MPTTRTSREPGDQKIKYKIFVPGVAVILIVVLALIEALVTGDAQKLTLVSTITTLDAKTTEFAPEPTATTPQRAESNTAVLVPTVADVQVQYLTTNLLSTLTKTVAPTASVKYGDELTYTLVISAAPGTQLALYDPLEGTAFARFVRRPDGIVHDDGVITGTLTVTSTNHVTVTFVTQVSITGTGTLAWPYTVANQACVYPFGGTLGGCAWSNEVTNPPTAPNIIFVIVDAVRADHVSSYGYARPTTPNLDGLIADQGVIFKNVTSPSSWTYPSNAAMLTGHKPSSIGIVWSDPQTSVPAEEVMLAEYLHDAGYYTAGFVTASYMQARFGFDQGFDVYQEHVLGGDNGMPAGELNAIVMDWLDNSLALSGTQPLFLYLYYFDPHSWYDPPSPYDELYDPIYTGTLTASVYGHGVGVISGAIVPTERDVEHLLALYDGEITYWDLHLGEMINYLDSLHLLDNSIIIVTSDHGQMFGEHGKWVHRNSLYEEVLQVPLAIRYTGAISPRLVVSTPVQTLDLTPSILDWIGLSVPKGLHGESLKALAQGQPTTETRDIFSEMGVDALSDPDWYAPLHELQSVRRGDWKYIHQPGFSDDDELYHLQPFSPYETSNLLELEPTIANNLLQALVNWFGIPTHYIYLPVCYKTI
jgi:arylsulfatase A-like enzyme